MHKGMSNGITCGYPCCICHFDTPYVALCRVRIQGNGQQTQTQWLSTGLPVKNRKKRVEVFLIDGSTLSFRIADVPVPTENELFADSIRH